MHDLTQVIYQKIGFHKDYHICLEYQAKKIKKTLKHRKDY